MKGQVTSSPVPIITHSILIPYNPHHFPFSFPIHSRKYSVPSLLVPSLSHTILPHTILILCVSIPSHLRLISSAPHLNSSPATSCLPIPIPSLWLASSLFPTLSLSRPLHSTLYCQHFHLHHHFPPPSALLRLSPPTLSCRPRQHTERSSAGARAARAVASAAAVGRQTELLLLVVT